MDAGRNRSTKSSFKVSDLLVDNIAINLFNKDWRKVEAYIGSRSGAQIRSHAQKYFGRIEKELPGWDIEAFIATKATAIRYTSNLEEIKSENVSENKVRARSVSVHQIMKAVDQPKCPEPNMTHSTVSVPTKKTSENKKATIKKTVEKTLKKRAKANSPPAFKSVL